MEIEDSLVEEEIDDTITPTGLSNVERYIIFDGHRMLKSRALSLYAKRLGNGGPSSTDRLKRVQEVERYGSSALGSNPIRNTAGNNEPLLVIQDPVATVVRCAGHLFLCIGEVNGIKVASESSMTVIPQADLRELEKVVVSIQVLGLQPATSNDDASLRHDWRTCRIKETTVHIPGQFIQPIDPQLVTRGFEHMFYLFEGSALVGLAATILGQLTSKNVKELGRIAHTEDFPYREISGMLNIFNQIVLLIFLTGKACFSCRSSTSELSNINGTTNSCTLCIPGYEYGTKTGQRPLEHIGAHILHDPGINREDEPCGRCLRPSSICRIFLSKGAGGSYKLNLNRSSGCGNPGYVFRYSVAATSTSTSPCSNVPVICPLCTDTKHLPAVWKYNLRYHISAHHPSALLSRYKHLWELTEFETKKMAAFWNERHSTVIRRPGKSKEAFKIIISEAHTSTIALAASSMDAEIDEQYEPPSGSEEDDEQEVQNDDSEEQVCLKPAFTSV